MSTKPKRQLNGSSVNTTDDMKDNLADQYPSETLAKHDIANANVSNTEVQPQAEQQPVSAPKAKKKRAYQPETGHGINYDHFGQMIQFVIGLGTPPYNPPGTRLPLVQLEALYASADLALQKVQEKKDVFETAINARQQAFELVPGLATQVYGQLIACGADAKMLSDFRTAKNLLTGKRAKALDPNETNENSVSASHTAFANRIWNWNTIVVLCAGFPAYESNDAALTVAALADVKDALVTTNEAVQAAYAEVTLARINRDKVMYAPITGMVPVALDVKQYAKAIFGFKSPEFRMINHLAFKNFLKK